VLQNEYIEQSEYIPVDYIDCWHSVALWDVWFLSCGQEGDSWQWFSVRWLHAVHNRLVSTVCKTLRQVFTR